MFDIQDTLPRGTTTLKEEPLGSQIGSVRNWMQPSIVDQTATRYRTSHLAFFGPSGPYPSPTVVHAYDVSPMMATRGLVVMTWSLPSRTISLPLQRVCRTSPGTLRETAAKQSAKEQLLPLRYSPVRPPGTACRNRADGIHRLRGEGQGT